MIKIIKMSPVLSTKSRKLLAFFDIQTDDEIIIKGFRLLRGMNCLFIASPEEKGKNGTFYEKVKLPNDMKMKLGQMAIEEYKSMV